MGARSKGELVLAYRAAVLLRLLTGWGWRRICKALQELGFNASPYNVIHWLYHGNKPYFVPTSFEKSLYYHRAFKLTVEVAAAHPDWGPKRVATYVSSLLPVRIPALTAYFWIRGLSKPNVTPVRPCPALGYLVGVLVGDHVRTRRGKGLYVKDREFAEYYAKMYKAVTGVKLKVYYNSKRGYYCTYEHAAWLRELWHSGLWKVIAFTYPHGFLRGLYDSEGHITPRIRSKEKKLYSVEVGLAVGSRDVKDFTVSLLRKLGFNVRERYFPPKNSVVKGEAVEFGECWDLVFYGWDNLQLFAELIGFREGRRRRRLELLLKLRHMSPRERYKEWTKHYVKAPNGRWVEKAPNPRPLYSYYPPIDLAVSHKISNQCKTIRTEQIGRIGAGAGI